MTLLQCLCAWANSICGQGGLYAANYIDAGCSSGTVYGEGKVTFGLFILGTDTALWLRGKGPFHPLDCAHTVCRSNLRSNTVEIDTDRHAFCSLEGPQARYPYYKEILEKSKRGATFPLSESFYWAPEPSAQAAHEDSHPTRPHFVIAPIRRSSSSFPQGNQASFAHSSEPRYPSVLPASLLI